jgi:hypothetical protein
MDVEMNNCNIQEQGTEETNLHQQIQSQIHLIALGNDTLHMNSPSNKSLHASFISKHQFHFVRLVLAYREENSMDTSILARISLSTH